MSLAHWSLRSLLLGLALIAIVVPAADAQAPPATPTEQAFLVGATQANLFEITTGTIAQRRARTAAVRRLGRLFVRHHTAMQAQVSAVAGPLGLTLPTALRPDQQVLVGRLRQVPRATFDRLWLRVQLQAHREALQLGLATGLATDVSAPVRQLAIASGPIVGEHYGRLREVYNALGTRRVRRPAAPCRTSAAVRAPRC